ncbi:MAG: DUF1223 domain-containing protein [Pseudomonadota bacterium]
MTLRICLLTLFFCSFSVRSEQVFRSDITQATVLELYTSEGCSSCPPADRWFATLVEHPQLWRGLIPVAFHVDYWNYLGWEDRFASSAYSQRQRAYYRQGSTQGVYTPGMMAAGREWHNWRRLQDAPISSEEVGVLELRDNGLVFSARFIPSHPQPRSELQLHVAVLGFGLKTPVERGENRGRDLSHDFVVLSHNVYSDSGLQWTGDIPISQYEGEAERLALVAWVGDRQRLGPIQATGGWRTP